MTPVINQLNQLSPVLLSTKRSLLRAFSEFTVQDLPSLVVVARDAPQAAPAAAAAPSPPFAHAASVARSASPPAGGAAPSAQERLENAQLEYAMLMPRGDALDATKSALRALFPVDR